MSGPYIVDDDRLAQAFREVFGQSVTFDMEQEIKKAGKALYGECCHACGAAEGPTCKSCKQAYRRGEE